MITNAKRIVLAASATTTSSSTGPTLNIPTGYRSAIIHLNVSAASGTSPTLNVRIQDVLQPPASTDTILNPPTLNTSTQVFDDFCSFTQATAAGDWVARINTQGASAAAVLADGSLAAGSVKVGPMGLFWRVKWTIAGTSPSFTWSLVAQLIP